ncbi:hemolysin E [Escherichia coli]|nr:hemolysin E [Escherichia coli]
MDLYNKYLDQVIPWQTFDETIKELSRFKQEYSQAASVLVGNIKTLLMDSQDKYFEATQTVYECVLRRNCSQRIFCYLMSIMRRKHPPRKTFSLRYWMTASRS